MTQLTEQKIRMDKKNTTIISEKVSFKDKHSFLIFITLSIFIAAGIVLISMTMYNGSGAAQLDLSRPGYVSVRSQATTDSDDFLNFPSTGAISKNDMSNFKTLYSKQAQRVETVDAFGGDPLSPDALNISAPSE